jgi:luciferase family oxidoreductase group 1
MRLSVLDQSPVSEGSSRAEALQNTLDLARLADDLGYHRYWVAEHHSSPMLAGASPEVLIGAIAGTTGGIRVGSGGVMLPHYSPFKVAETFTTLAALHPHRIDLGVGRAAGTDALTTRALQRDRRRSSPGDFDEQLSELLAYLNDSLPDGHPFAKLCETLPGPPYVPEPWLLGSSEQSAIWAAEHALPYAFADFINPSGAEWAATYRRRYGQPRDGAEPVTAVAASVVCADTDEQARRLAASTEMTRRLLQRGQPIPVPSPEKALQFMRSEERITGVPLPRRRVIVGSPEQVRDGLEALIEEYEASEVMVVTIAYDHAARRRSYELVAEAIGVERRGATKTRSRR